MICSGDHIHILESILESIFEFLVDAIVVSVMSSTIRMSYLVASDRPLLRFSINFWSGLLLLGHIDIICDAWNYVSVHGDLISDFFGSIQMKFKGFRQF